MLILSIKRYLFEDTLKNQFQMTFQLSCFYENDSLPGVLVSDIASIALKFEAT